jgi:hypothetical protein
MIIPMMHKLFQSPEKYGAFPNSYYQSSITLILKSKKETKVNRQKKKKMTVQNSFITTDSKILN